MSGAGYSVWGKRGYMSWQGKNIFLSPAHECMNDCIWYWHQEWDPGLIMIKIRTNHHRGLIYMLSGGKWADYVNLIQGKDKNWKPDNLRWTALTPICHFHHILVWRSDRRPAVWPYYVCDTKIQTITGIIPYMATQLIK